MVVQIFEWLKTNYLELAGFASSLVCVWLNMKANIWGWFWAVISSIISAIFFYQLKLWGDMSLQYFFVVASLYGWYQWRYSHEAAATSTLTIGFLPASYFLPLGLSGGCIFGVIYGILSYFNSDFTFFDALTTTLSIIATWLMARKYTENWLLWIIADLIYLVMYFLKNAYWYTFLYAIFLLMAYRGWVLWRVKAPLSGNEKRLM